MLLTKSEFGHMLMAKLEATTDVVVLSRWAYQTYLDNSRRLEPGLKDVLRDLGRMEEAAEFEYSIPELFEMAKTMIGEDR